MSKQPPRRSAGKRRPQARKGRTAVAAKRGSGRNDLTGWIIAAIVIVVGGALVFVFASGTKKTFGPIKDRKAAPSSLVSKITKISAKTIAEVGEGSVSNLPSKLPGPPLVKDGIPRVVYLGAEYCPYCATERWGLVQALTRFGTFSNLQITTSGAAPELFPDTATFSFHGATYTSKYVSFEAIEQENNERKPLETPTAEQAALSAKFDRAPYVEGTPDAIPFIDFGNQFVISGASYKPDVLGGKSHDEIAAAMTDPSTDISQGAVGSANAITATICKITDGKPANVCKAVATIEAKLG